MHHRLRSVAIIKRQSCCCNAGATSAARYPQHSAPTCVLDEVRACASAFTVAVEFCVASRVNQAQGRQVRISVKMPRLWTSSSTLSQTWSCYVCVTALPTALALTVP